MTIGERCVIGANTVVTTDLPPRSIAAGAPAQVLRTIEYPGQALLGITMTPNTSAPTRRPAGSAASAPKANRGRRRPRAARLDRLPAP